MVLDRLKESYWSYLAETQKLRHFPYKWLHLESQAKQTIKNETWFDGPRWSHLTWLAAKRQETEESASDRFCYSCNGHRPIISAHLKWDSLLSYKSSFFQSTSELWPLPWYSNPSLPRTTSWYVIRTSWAPSAEADVALWRAHRPDQPVLKWQAFQRGVVFGIGILSSWLR